MRYVEAHRLDPLEQQLLEAAAKASRTASCSYSGFPVGAAVLIEGKDGAQSVVTGSNYETINYYSVCAEKHAVMRAMAEHSWENSQGQLQRPRVLSVAVHCAVAGTPQQPCGDCRQTLHEVNPHMRVLSWSGPGRGSAHHDPRVSISGIGELLPHSFDNDGLLGNDDNSPSIIDDTDLASFVVHLPKPADLTQDAQARARLLHGVEHLLLVGSPRRARRIATLAHESFGALESPDEACYCDLTQPGRDESSREYVLYTFTLPNKVRVAVASHGIGCAGAEILLSEIPALLALAQGQAPKIKSVIRCGTRGTLSRVPLGCVALTTSSHDPSLNREEPDAALLDRIREAATARQMEVVPEADINTRQDWPEMGTGLLIEGSGLSARFFWAGQGRPTYRPVPLAPASAEASRRQRAHMLSTWVKQGIHWVEMEDYTILRACADYGYPAVTLGAVIAHRRSSEGVFQLDYSKKALAASEMLPAVLALQALSDI